MTSDSKEPEEPESPEYEEFFDAMDEVVEPRRLKRTNAGKPPSRFGDYRLYSAVAMNQIEPGPYKEAISSPNAHDWLMAMQEELDAIGRNQTWELVELSAGRKAIGSKWVYKIKHDESGTPIMYKARLVAQSFSQKYGVDYNEVFAPVARSTTFRAVMSVVGVRNYHVKHHDVKSAFLHGGIEEEIYMKQPPGFGDGNKVCRLRKSLFGLKQAARV